MSALTLPAGPAPAGRAGPVPAGPVPAGVSKVLVCNRGEVAVRIVRACHDLGLPAVVAHSDADRDSRAVQLADEAVCIGAGPAGRSYLNVPAILYACARTGADAVHPGYGFLAEDAVLRAGLRGGGHHLHRPAGRGDPADGRQDRGPGSGGPAPGCRSRPAPRAR